MIRLVRVFVLSLAVMATLACQSPSSTDDIAYSDAIDVTSSPDPIIAEPSTDGRTYRLPRTNQPDDVLPFDWHAVFGITIRFNNNATDDDIDIAFPARLTSTSIVVRQAVAGVVVAPTGSDIEHYDFAPLAASGSIVSGVNSPITMTLETWYDLPSLRKEAVITITLSFIDDDGVVFQRVVDFRVAP